MLPTNIDIGKLSEPVTALINKISNAIGVVYEPRKIIQNAKATAEANKILALSRIEITELEQRAIDRLIYQESIKQRNIESITTEAIRFLPNNAEVGNLNEDWITHFFKQCDHISDVEMQLLWGKILSAEANKSGSFSKRTISLVSTFDKKDAELFTNFCQFVWNFGEPTPIIFDPSNEIYTSQKIDFTSLNHLQTIGLISFDPLAGYMKKNLPKHFAILYFEKPLIIECQENGNNQIQIGKVLLTSTGIELFKICGSKPNFNFEVYVSDVWAKEGLVLSSPIQQPK